MWRLWRGKLSTFQTGFRKESNTEATRTGNTNMVTDEDLVNFTSEFWACNYWRADPSGLAV
jgi:hypothetical protein